jgi:hypothetical protein
MNLAIALYVQETAVMIVANKMYASWIYPKSRIKRRKIK